MECENCGHELEEDERYFDVLGTVICFYCMMDDFSRYFNREDEF